MDETLYHTIAGATLEHCFSQLEEAYESGSLDELELESGILTIKTPSGRTFLLSKHAPSHELWYASPIGGGLHFRFSETTRTWNLSNGTELYECIRAELSQEGVKVIL